jgi:hypothetical protein
MWAASPKKISAFSRCARVPIPDRFESNPTPANGNWIAATAFEVYVAETRANAASRMAALISLPEEWVRGIHHTLLKAVGRVPCAERISYFNQTSLEVRQ